LIPRTPQEERKLKAFLLRELALFNDIQGPTHRTEHTIRVKAGNSDQATILAAKSRHAESEVIFDEEVRAMEAEGVIEPSTSAWSSPVVIVRKKDGKPRFC